VVCLFTGIANYTVWCQQDKIGTSVGEIFESDLTDSCVCVSGFMMGVMRVE